jgi:aminopeptidase N
MVLHALRHLIGEDALRETLRRFVYPTDAARQATGGRQARHVTTDDFVRTAEAVSGRDLDWFFDAYLYHATPPRLDVQRQDATLRLQWQTPSPTGFPMPLDVAVGDTTRRVAMEESTATVPLPSDTTQVTVDPKGWVLRAP